MARSPSDGQLDELRVECDRGVEHLRDWAILLGFARNTGKAGFVEVRHLTPQGESRLADPEALAIGIERDRGLRGEFCRIEARRLQAESQRHGETPGVGSRNQFLRIGALLVLEASLEGIGRAVEYT